MANPPYDPFGLTTTVGPFKISFSRMAVAHSLIWSTSELHTRAIPVEGGAWKPPMATGAWVAAVVAGLYSRSDAVVKLESHGLGLGELTEIDVTYQAPVFGDSVILARCAVLECKFTGAGEPDRIVIEDVCTGPDGRQLLSCRRTHRPVRRELG